MTATRFVGRKLDDVDLIAMFIDGIEFAGHAVLIALGVTIDGTKTPLGVWAGSTENTTVVTELLSNLVGRGLPVEQSMLFVIDGKAIRKALRDVFGDRAVVQRCQVHKARNVRDHLREGCVKSNVSTRSSTGGRGACAARVERWGARSEPRQAV